MSWANSGLRDPRERIPIKHVTVFVHPALRIIDEWIGGNTSIGATTARRTGLG
jgi:hypothetical protein